MDRARVLLAEDHPLMQQTLGELLNEDHVLIGIVSRGDMLPDMLHRLRPDAVVLDVWLVDGCSVQLLPKLRQHYPDIALVVVTADRDPIYRTEALRQGADEFVLKCDVRSKLLPALNSALSLRRYTAGLRSRKKSQT